jgi:acetyl-CoA carboxylase biotin carboxyl carrier protein
MGMTDSPPNQDVFDVRKIRRLVELMTERDLTEIDLRNGEQRVRIRRGPEPAAGGTPRVAVSPPAATAPAPQPSREVSGAAVQAAPQEDYIVLIKSPMVGTFYAASDPDSPAYIKVGDPVGPETVVCIVEAMKVFNQIPAEVSGTIVGVLVENGEPVEYGQPLFKVDTRK